MTKKINQTAVWNQTVEEQSLPLRAGFSFALMAVLMAAIPETHGTESSANANDFFIPGNQHYYNPLKHSNDRVTTDYKPNATALDNKSLIEAANHFRSNDMNALQRELNYQWLHQQHHNKDIYLGSKVVSKIFKMGFKTYWKNLRKSQNPLGKSSMTPDAEGKGKLMGDLNYNMRVSGDKLKVSVKYEF